MVLIFVRGGEAISLKQVGAREKFEKKNLKKCKERGHHALIVSKIYVPAIGVFDRLTSVKMIPAQKHLRKLLVKRSLM